MTSIAKLGYTLSVKEDVHIVEQSDGVLAYDCGPAYYVRLEKGAVVSDHAHRRGETLYLLEGAIEMVIGTKSKRIIAPAKIKIPRKTYHKITALTDATGLEIKPKSLFFR